MTDKSFFASTNENRINNQFYCPFCDHCNNLKDSKLEEYIWAINESKNLINKGVEYILKSKFLEQNNLDFFNLSDKITAANENNENKDDKKQQFFESEKLVMNFPKMKNDSRLTYVTISHFLNALIEDKLNLDSIINNSLYEKISNSILSQGLSFDNNDDNKLIFDPEIANLLDENSKGIIENLFRSIITYNF